ncbi:signal peptidase II [Maricaulis maris]|jgi:signal peptidase II|uniref:signal peptidase II n=1 Tax=Maricaulis maris TaxID=74318 RepID=UPI002924826E|nr:lipoprotein signal peptidase [Maricaulis maris]
MPDWATDIRRRFAASPVPALGLGLAAIILVLDQLTKWWVLAGLNFSPPGCLDYQRAEGAERLALPNTCGHIEVSPVFDLTMVWNKGVSFGLLGADGPVGRTILIAFSVLVAAGLIAGLLNRGPIRATRRLQGVAFGFIIGGALGNAIDRGLYGAVVDFLNFSDVYFPYVFNVADVGINLGVVAIVLDVFLNDRKPAAGT